MKNMYVRPATIREASAFVGELHRHHGEPQGGKFALACVLGGKTVGYAVVGRPVARRFDQRGYIAEVTRLCTDGTRNACSFLYGAAARTALEMGYCKIITYTLDSEDGASLRAAGWTREAEIKGGSWSSPNRPRIDKAPLDPKIRWSRVLRPDRLRRLLDLENLV